MKYEHNTHSLIRDALILCVSIAWTQPLDGWNISEINSLERKCSTQNMVAKDNSIYNKSTPSGHSILKKRNPSSQNTLTLSFARSLSYTYSNININSNNNGNGNGNILHSQLSQFRLSLYRWTIFCLVFAVRFAFIFAACTKHISFIPEDPFKCLCVSLSVCVHCVQPKKRYTHVGLMCVACVHIYASIHCIIMG